MSNNLESRINFSSIKNASNYPDFLDIQIKSFKDFFQLEPKSDERESEGLFNTFQDNFPISDVLLIFSNLSSSLKLKLLLIPILILSPSST